MGLLKLVDTFQTHYPTKKELAKIIADEEFLEELMIFRSKSPIESATCFHMCWALSKLISRLTFEYPELSYIGVYFDNESGEYFKYEGDLGEALDVMICFRNYGL